MTDTDDKIESITDKITKLLAKAESTTPEEAEALTTKATELMIRWSIDEAMLAARRGQLTDKIVEKTIEVGGIYWQAHQQLGLRIGHAFSFRLIQRNWSNTPKMKGAFTWVGFESDVTKAELLYTSLLIQSTSGMTKFAKRWREDHAHLGGMEAYKARRSFLLGFTDAVYSRLVDQFRLTVAKMSREETNGERSQTSSVELVLRSKNEKVREYYDEKYGKLRPARGKRLQNGVGGVAAGRAAGMAADIGGTGISGSNGAIGRG